MPVTTPTQSEIIKLLRDRAGNFVSGADLADKFGISRTGIWKHIRKLKAMGYDIVSHPKDGYMLVEIPDLLTEEAVRPILTTRWLGRSWHFLETVGSTNDHALLLAAQGEPHGAVVVAEEQTGGRGRLGRKWVSAKGRGIYMSILLRDSLPVRIAPQTIYVAGFSLAKVLRSQFGLRATMKWPNDILIEGRKVAGILAEMQSDQDLSRFMVVGVGINVNSSSEEMSGPFRYPATSISIQMGRAVKRLDLLAPFLSRFEEDYEEFLREGFSHLIADLEAFSEILGKKITILFGERQICGKAMGFTQDGALLLLKDDGETESVWAGDVARVEGAI